MRALLVIAFLAAILFSSFAPSSAAGQTAGLQARVEAVTTDTAPTIGVTVTILDGAGRPVADIPASGFQAQVGARTLPLLAAANSAGQDIPIATVLVFDVSGSMQGQPLSQAKAAGKALVEQLGPRDEVAILAFADAVATVQSFTSDRALLTQAIDGLVSGGNTALYDAVAGSVGLAAQSPLPRRTVVLLSDGQNFGNTGTVNRAGSIEAMRAAGVPVFLVGLGNLVDQAYLQELAAAGSGQLMLAPQPQALTALYQDIGAILRRQYVLSLDAGSLAAGEPSVLRITVSHGGSVAVAEASLRLPAPAAPPPDAAPSAPAPEGSGEGTSTLLLFAPAAAAGAVLLAAIFWWRRRRRPQAPAEPEQPSRSQPQAILRPPLEAAPPDSGAASLHLMTPTNGAVYSLAQAGLTLGFTYDCDVHLPHGDDGRRERVRIWRREGRYMLHNLSPIGTVTIAGRRAVWVVLEDGDEIQIGPCSLRFSLP